MVSYVPDPEEVHLKDSIAFAYRKFQSKAPKNKEVKREDSAILEKNMTDVRSEDDRYVQAGVTPDDD